MDLTNKQKKLAEQLLLSVIHRENVVEYSELASRINPPIFWRQVGHEIGEVSKLCHKLGLPLLSAKVTAKGSGIAGEGFFNLMKELGIDTSGGTEKEVFLKELKRIRECTEWYKLADYLGLEMDFEPLYENIRNINASKPSTDENNKQKPVSWIFPSNNQAYNVIRAFEELPEIDWRQRVDLKVGDVIYLYCTKPYQRIMFKAIITKIDIPCKGTIDDKVYWNSDYFEDNFQYKFARLKLLKAVDSELLSLSKLMGHGLNGAPQSALRSNEILTNYIENIFASGTSMYEPILLAEELDEKKVQTYTEGSKKQVFINAYERNALARNDCVRIHGSKCAICGFDFGSFYGKEFDGKIHVHHIKPIYTINEKYEVDPEHDLIPVCPNCHMVLHLKSDGVYEINEVKQMIVKNKK